MLNGIKMVKLSKELLFMAYKEKEKNILLAKIKGLAVYKKLKKVKA